MSLNLELSFKKSRSKDLSTVLRYCRIFDLFVESEDYKLTIVSFEELYQKWDEFNSIYHYTKRWSGTSLFFNGKPHTTNDVFYLLQDLKDCYKQYRVVNNRQLYCDGADWGCHKLKSLYRYIDDSFGPYWYDYGYFEGDNTWIVDKDRIMEVLINEAKDKSVFSCPIFSERVIYSHLVRLPDEIHIDGEKWKKKYRIRETVDGPVKIAYGIEHVMAEYSDSEIPEFKNDFEPVVPDGLSDNELANWYIEMFQKGLLK